MQFYSRIRQVNVERLENVQAWAKKFIPSTCYKGNQRRQTDLGLFIFEQRRLRGLLIETFKIFREFRFWIRLLCLNCLAANGTRNHGYKLVSPMFNTVLYRDFPTVRLWILWNSLPEAVENALSVDVFNMKLDKILPSLFLWGTRGWLTSLLSLLTRLWQLSIDFYNPPTSMSTAW